MRLKQSRAKQHTRELMKANFHVKCHFLTSIIPNICVYTGCFSSHQHINIISPPTALCTTPVSRSDAAFSTSTIGSLQALFKIYTPTKLAFPLIYTPLPGGFLPSTHAVAAPLDFFFGVRLSIFPFVGLFFLSCSEAGPSWIDSRKRGSEPLSCHCYCYSYSSCYWTGLLLLDGFGHQFPFSRALHSHSHSHSSPAHS